MPLYRTIWHLIIRPNQGRYEFLLTTTYWRLRSLLNTISFKISAFFYKIRQGVSQSTSNTALFSNVALRLLPKLLFAGLIVVALELLEKWDIGFLSLLRGFFKNWSLDADVYRDTLTAVVQVSGVFLGLYFTAVSVVASTVYSEVSSDIRALLIREKTGNQYLNVLALLASVALIALLLIGFGYKTGLLLFLFIILMSIYAILSFVKLGLRIFYFFNPGILADELNYDIQKFILMATVKGYRWCDKSFQAHCRKVVGDLLLTYQNVIDYAIVNHKRYSGKDLETLLDGLQVLFGMYVINKHRIPTKSFWYGRKYKHKDWLLTSFSEISMAINTGTQLIPIEEPEEDWFEKELTPMIGDLFEKLLLRRNYEYALRSLTRLGKRIQHNSRFYATREASLLLKEVLNVIIETLTKESSNQSSEEEPNTKYKVAIIDALANVQIAILLGASEAIERINERSIRESAVKAAKSRRFRFYSKVLPKEALEMLEYLVTGVSNERIIENNILSPNWYLDQLIGLALVRYIDSFLQTYISDIERVFGNESKQLLDRKEIFLAMQCLQRGLEACDKLHFHMDVFENCYKLIEGMRHLSDVPWMTVVWEDMHAKVREIRKALVGTLADATKPILNKDDVIDLPDYLGYAFTTLESEYFNYLMSGEEGMAEKIFEILLPVTLFIHDRVTQRVEREEPRTQMALRADPILDILALSGYALIFDDLDDKQFKKGVSESWQKLLSDVSIKKRLLNLIFGLLHAKKLVIGITQRDTLRSQWELNISRILRERDILRDDLDLHPYYGHKKTISHSKKLIRYIVQHSHMGVISLDPKDVFIGLFLADYFTKEGIALPNDTKQFLEWYNRFESDETAESESV